jgi:hypothetical protein
LALSSNPTRSPHLDAEPYCPPRKRHGPKEKVSKRFFLKKEAKTFATKSHVSKGAH